MSFRTPSSPQCGAGYPSLAERRRVLLGTPESGATVAYRADDPRQLIFPWVTFDKFLAILALTERGQRNLRLHNERTLGIIYRRYVEPVRQLMRLNGLDAPVLATVGDSRNDYEFPTFTKSCQIASNKKSRYILNLNERRHWRYVAQVPRADIPHDRKRKGLVWRGDTTGSFDFKHQHSPFRANLARRFEEFTAHDVGFTNIVQIKPDASCIPFADLQEMLRKPLSIRQQLRYRYVLSLEGNDVASGLKWMLYSNSTVLMPHPTCEGWACESLLRPYEHYVPVADDLSDLNSQVAWCDAHPDEARRIALTGQAFIKEILRHDNAALASEIFVAASRAGQVELDPDMQARIDVIRDEPNAGQEFRRPSGRARDRIRRIARQLRHMLR